MPRYYFDVHNGSGQVRDIEGTEFPDETSARREAARTVSAMAIDQAIADRSGEIVLQVFDGHRKTVCEVVLTYRTPNGHG